MKTPKPLEFRVTRIGPMQKAGDDRAFLECTTSVGTVAFWGDGDSMINIEGIEGRRVPFRVRAACLQPDPPYDQRHSLWVPATARIDFL